MRKLLTIAIPVYNRRAFLARALDSIYSQSSLDEIEVIVSDNCSTDGTEEFLNAYCAGRDIIRLKNSENLGADRNFLNCYQKASGKYVMLLGSDDVLLPGALDVIVSFLNEHPTVDWVFLNHAVYKDNPMNNCSVFADESSASGLKDREAFVSYAKEELSFISCNIIETDLINKVENPTKYQGSFFLHTNLMLDASLDPDTVFGVITKCCILKDGSDGNSGIERIPGGQFLVFGKWMYYSLCQIAVENGFSSKTMRRIYINRLVSYWPRMILSMKAKHINNWQKSFWENGYPYIKQFPLAWLTIMPAVFTPTFLCVFLYKFVRPVFKKLKAVRGHRGG